MIELHVEDYCQNCSDFEPDVSKDELFAGDKVYCTNTYIKCEYRKRCASLASYLKEAINK